MGSTLIMTFFTAFALENPVLSRALGLSSWWRRENSVKTIAEYGATFTVIAVLSTLINVNINYQIANLPTVTMLRAPLFLITVIAIFLAIYFGLKKFLPKWFHEIQSFLPIATFNTGLFAIFFVFANRHYSILQAIGYALGTGAGYTLALLVLFFARKRLALCPIPASFRGIPILLVYIGLLSLALFGLLGHGGSI